MTAMDQELQREMNYLRLLSTKFPTIQSVCTEIINLKAIMDLPKGTEHFMSDLHGENEAFYHILNNASGVVREKVDKVFGNSMSAAERAELATLIYYPESKLEIAKRQQSDLHEWYRLTLHRLIDVCRWTSSKYTRSKVRKPCLPIFLISLMSCSTPTMKPKTRSSTITESFPLSSTLTGRMPLL